MESIKSDCCGAELVTTCGNKRFICIHCGKSHEPTKEELSAYLRQFGGSHGVMKE